MSDAMDIHTASLHIDMWKARAEKAEADLILLQSTHKTALLALEMLGQEVINERQAKEKAEADRAELLDEMMTTRDFLKLLSLTRGICLPETIDNLDALIAHLAGETK
jgi:hypothetical protein